MAPLTNTMHVSSAAAPNGLPTGRKRMRRIARGLGLVLALIAGLALVGAGYEAIAARGDAQAYPAPGQLVDVGGYSLHIHCVGFGVESAGHCSQHQKAPAPLLWCLMPGWAAHRSTGTWSSHKSGRRPAFVPTTTRAWAGARVAQRRAPRPGLQASCTHCSATRASRGLTSWWGTRWLARTCVCSRGSTLTKSPGWCWSTRGSEYVDEHGSPTEEKGFQQMVAAQGELYGLARTLGLVRLFGASIEGTPAMTPATRLEMALFASGQQGIDATFAEALERTTDDGQLQAAPALGDLPLLVLAAGESMEQIPYWPEAQRRLAALSTQGRLIVVEESGHSIHAEQPARVIDAVRQVVDEARGH